MIEGGAAHVRLRDYALDEAEQRGLHSSLRKWLARTGLILGSLLVNGTYLLARPRAGVGGESKGEETTLDRRL
ncbi:MAG TPA: hypothetical protein VFY81_14735 [Gammaproteobacteria bacterium]|jgi:hypothetical protein|nr:hypothetical protein [Gammaproteobacteria bacterium]